MAEVLVVIVGGFAEATWWHVAEALMIGDGTGGGMRALAVAVVLIKALCIHSANLLDTIAHFALGITYVV